MALSFLLDEINKIEKSSIREIFRFCFTASVGQASRMVFVVKRRGKTKNRVVDFERKEVGSWVIGYWVPKESFEINVWNCFENRWQRIIKAKAEQARIEYKYEGAKNFNELSNTFSNVLLVNDSAINALANVPDNSVDYVITDPPHGDRIPYLELSMMWNEWLQFNVNYENEIVISDSKNRGKGKKEYHRLLNQVLSEIERVLKPDHYFSLMFNSLDDDTWINLVQHINSLNLDLHRIETIGYSANSVVQDNREGGLKTDFIFTYKKNIKKITQPIYFYSCNQENKREFIEIITGYLKIDNVGRETYEILNYLVNVFLRQSRFFKPSEVVNLLRSNFQMENGKWIVVGDLNESV